MVFLLELNCFSSSLAMNILWSALRLRPSRDPKYATWLSLISLKNAFDLVTTFKLLCAVLGSKQGMFSLIHLLTKSVISAQTAVPVTMLDQVGFGGSCLASDVFGISPLGSSLVCLINISGLCC